MTKCAVVVSRNDNYGDNLIHRAKLSLENNSKVFDHIIYVDWKTVNRPLTDELNIDKRNIETISISEEYIANKWPQFVNYPIVETIARNIGIRKAIEKYDYVCSTNIDVIINNFNIDNLCNDTLYTARRRNVPQEAHLSFSDNILSQLINQKDSFELAPMAVKDGRGIWDPGDDWSLVVCCGDFQFAHRNLWADIRGFEEEMAGRCYADSNLMKRPIIIGKKTAIADVDVFHLNHTNYSERLPTEYLPVNDQYKYVNDWVKSTNNTKWGIL